MKKRKNKKWNKRQLTAHHVPPRSRGETQFILDVEAVNIPLSYLGLWLPEEKQEKEQ